MDINQTHLSWNTIINHPQPPPIDHHPHLQNPSTLFPSFHHSQLDHNFPPPSPNSQLHHPTQEYHHPKQPLRPETRNSSREKHSEEQRGDEDEEVEVEEEEELGAMKEMMYRMAAMQPVEIDPASIRKPRRRNVRISDDPQSVAARHRRERISEKIRILQRLVPGGTKLDTASMLEEAVRYVKFLKRQIRLLQTTSSSSTTNINDSTTPSDPHQITTRSNGFVVHHGLGGFGIDAAGAGAGADGVLHVGGGDHRLVCFGGDREVISDT